MWIRFEGDESSPVQIVDYSLDILAIRTHVTGQPGNRLRALHAIWESTAAFRTAFSHPQFRASLAAYPSSTIASPHLLQKVAVAGICVA